MFKFISTEIKDLKIIEPRVFQDSRGYFFESYKQSSFIENGIEGSIVQTNQSFSSKDVVRGLHFQTGEFAQAKLVRCLVGEIYDVAVDLRSNSQTFGQSFGVKLSSENKKMLYIPVGFAHGFSVLSDVAEVSYDVFGGSYNKESEGGIRFDDPTLEINWGVQKPIISDKDLILPFLNDLNNPF